MDIFTEILKAFVLAYGVVLTLLFIRGLVFKDKIFTKYGAIGIALTLFCYLLM